MDTKQFTTSGIVKGRIRDVSVHGTVARYWLRQGSVPPAVVRARRAWEWLVLALLEQEKKRTKDIDRSFCAWGFLGFVKALEMALLRGGASSDDENEEGEELTQQQREQEFLMREQQMLQVQSLDVMHYMHVFL